MLGYIGEELIRKSSFPALYISEEVQQIVSGRYTWKSSFRTKFANEYMPIFFPSGLPSLIPLRFVLLSVKHIVNARCIDSAVPSTNDFLVSPGSMLATFRNCRVKSGLLSKVIASFARASQSCMVAGRIMIPYCECDRAVMHALPYMLG